MQEYVKKAHDLVNRIKSYFIGSGSLEENLAIKKKQMLNMVILGFVVLFGVVAILVFISKEDVRDFEQTQEEGIAPEHETIELATDAIKGDVKWHNFLEESIEEESTKRQQQLDILKNTIENSAAGQKEEISAEFTELKSRLAYALNEIDRLKVDNQNIQNDLASVAGAEAVVMPAELGITSIVDRVNTGRPLSSYNHIPATSYVSGNLLGGVAVSTSVNSASEPIPVVIKLTGRGNLPDEFAVDIKQCRLLASCYGDISSERAIIRAEELVCEDKEEGLIISTKVAGVIYGDDGANGIRGTVVSMGDKHLKNAFLGGVLSGFSSSGKGQGSFNITSLGAVSSKKRGVRDMAEDGLMGGAGSAAEKLADYHIKLAENISPVILIPGGTKVDVMFTRSVQVGSFDVEEVINKERVSQ